MLNQATFNSLLKTVANVFHEWGADTEWAIVPPAMIDCDCGEWISMNYFYDSSPYNWSTGIITYHVSTNGYGGVNVSPAVPIQRNYFNAPLFSQHPEYKDLWNQGFIDICQSPDLWLSGYYFKLQEPYSDLPITYYRGQSNQLCIYPVGSTTAKTDCFEYIYEYPHSNSYLSNAIRFTANCTIMSTDNAYSISGGTTKTTNNITTFGILKNSPLIYNDSNTTNNIKTNITNNWDITYNNTVNYITEAGDELTINITDNTISLGGVGGAGGLGGLINLGGLFPIGVSGTVSFDDIIGALNIGVNDYNETNGTDLYVPSFDELIYGDQGDFNITPIDQIRQLPTAPEFDVDLDVGSFPQTIGHSVQSILDIADSVLGVGGSALLLGSLFFSFLWIKLKRR